MTELPSSSQSGSDHPAPVRVLISYAHGDLVHEERIEQLWRFLRSRGIDAKVDLTAAAKVVDWPAWMSEQIELSQYVLVVASPRYQIRAEGKAPVGEGRGVSWEARLLMDRLYRRDVKVEGMPEIIGVVLPGDDPKDLPAWLTPESRTRCDVTAFTEAGAESLLRLLTGQAAYPEDDLGQVPVLAPKRGRAATGATSVTPEYYRATYIRQYENVTELLAQDELAIVDSLSRSDLQRVYVSSECTDETGKTRVLDDYVSGWLSNPQDRFLVILGEYGYGKTSYVLQLTYTLLKAWPGVGGTVPFPVFISFRDLVPSNNTGVGDTISDRMITILRDKYQLIHTREDLIAGLGDRPMLLILDGLDEIEKSLSIDWIAKQFRSIDHITQHFAKVIVTCRVSYLSNEDDVRHVMSRNQYQLISGSVARGADLSIVTMQSFSDRQKENYVEQAVSDPAERAALIAAMRNVPDLPDLTTRPVLLNMVVSIFRTRLVDFSELSRMKAAELYERFTAQWLRNELSQDHIGRDLLENQELMHRLALKIYKDPAEQIAKSELLRELKISYPERSDAERARLAHEFVVCSFFRPSQVDHYGFVHRSFLEFFVARAYLSYLEEDRAEAFGRERLRPGLVSQFLAQLVEGREYLYVTLQNWLLQPGAFVHGESRLAANAATVLAKSGFQFRGFDLSGADLRDADLSGADFRGANLREARLDNTLLERTLLSDSDLRQADMPNVFIRETDFRGADLRGANLKNPRIVGGPDTVWVAMFSRDQRYVAVGTDRGALIVLSNDHDGEVVSRLHVHDSGVMNIAFNADGTLLAVTNRLREIYLYDWAALVAGNPLTPTVFADNANYVRWIEFSPDGQRLASGARDLMVKVWFLGDDPQVTTLKYHSRDVMCVTWSPDGQYLASAGYDGTIALWDVASDRPRPVELLDRQLSAGRGVRGARELLSHAGPIRALAFSPDGRILASSSEDRTIKLWNLEDPSYPVRERVIASDHDVFCLAYADAGAALITGDSGGGITKYDLEEGQVLTSRQAHLSRLRSFDLNQDRTELLTSSWDGSVKSWNVRDLTSARTIYQLPDAGTTYFRPDAFSEANIFGVRGIEKQFRDYFIVLGAVETPGDTEPTVTSERDDVMTTEVQGDRIFDLPNVIERARLLSALDQATNQAWFAEVFHEWTPGVVPASFEHFETLVAADIISQDGAALHRLNLLAGKYFLTDGRWRWNGAFHFVDESQLIMDYCRGQDFGHFDAIVDPGAGCGHTPIAFPGLMTRYAFDVDQRAVDFARLNSWLNDTPVTVERNDVTGGLPAQVSSHDGLRYLFTVNMPFAISPYAGALAQMRDGGETGIKLSVSTLDAVQPFVGTGSKLVMLTYSLGSGEGPEPRWQFVDRAREILPDSRIKWTLTTEKIWRVGVDKIATNPMPLTLMKEKASTPLRSAEDQKRLRDGYTKLAKELQSLGWDKLGCGILEVDL